MNGNRHAIAQASISHQFTLALCRESFLQILEIGPLLGFRSRLDLRCGLARNGAQIFYPRPSALIMRTITPHRSIFTKSPHAIFVKKHRNFVYLRTCLANGCPCNCSHYNEILHRERLFRMLLWHPSHTLKNNPIHASIANISKIDVTWWHIAFGLAKERLRQRRQLLDAVQ